MSWSSDRGESAGVTIRSMTMLKLRYCYEKRLFCIISRRPIDGPARQTIRRFLVFGM
jgi:hypothetical protein